MIKTKKYRISSKRKELYKLTYTIYDFYEDYSDKTISRQKYIQILKDFYSLFVQKIIVDRKRITLPYGLSTHRIKKLKASKNLTPKIDFNKSKIYGKKVYHLNTHTLGFYFIWFWEKNKSPLKNKKLYNFESTKKNNLALAKEIFKCNKDPFIKDYDALR